MYALVVTLKDGLVDWAVSNNSIETLKARVPEELPWSVPQALGVVQETADEYHVYTIIEVED